MHGNVYKRLLLLACLACCSAQADTFVLNFGPGTRTFFIGGDSSPYPFTTTAFFTTDGVCSVCTLTQKATSPVTISSDGLLDFGTNGLLGIVLAVGDPTDPNFNPHVDFRGTYDRTTSSFSAFITLDPGIDFMNMEFTNSFYGTYHIVDPGNATVSGPLSLLPEPTSIILLATVLIGLGFAMRRRILHNRYF